MRLSILIVGITGLFISGCGNNSATPPSSSETVSAPAAPQTEMKALSPTASSGNNLLAAGIQHLQQGDLPEAIQAFDQAVRQNPADPQAYVILGQTYMRLQDYTRAVDSFSAAAAVAPDSGEIFYLLALNQGLLGEFEAAKVSAQRSVEIFSEQKDEANFKQSLALLQSFIAAEEPAADVADNAVTSTAPTQP